MLDNQKAIMHTYLNKPSLSAFKNGLSSVYANSLDSETHKTTSMHCWTTKKKTLLTNKTLLRNIKKQRLWTPLLKQWNNRRDATIKVTIDRTKGSLKIDKLPPLNHLCAEASRKIVGKHRGNEWIQTKQIQPVHWRIRRKRKMHAPLKRHLTTSSAAAQNHQRSTFLSLSRGAKRGWVGFGLLSHLTFYSLCNRFRARRFTAHCVRAAAAHKRDVSLSLLWLRHAAKKTSRSPPAEFEIFSIARCTGVWAIKKALHAFAVFFSCTPKNESTMCWMDKKFSPSR